MTQQMKSEVAQYTSLAMQTILIGLSTWLLLSVNQLLISDAQQTERINNIKEGLDEIKGIKHLPTGRVQSKPTAPPATTYVHTNKYIK